MRFLAVRNFDRFQHYKERRPPWIKLYQEVLEDYAFTRLQDASKAHLIAIWLLASRYENRIPFDPEWIATAIHATEAVDLDGLVTAGFLVAYDGASEPLAERLQSAMPEEEEEGESERETPSSSSARATIEGVVADALPTDADRVALTTVVARAAVPESWLAEMQACLGGMPGHLTLTAEQLGEALRDFVANGATDGRPSLKHFRGYLRSAARKRVEPEHAPRRRAGVAERSYANALAAVGGGTP